MKCLTRIFVGIALCASLWACQSDKPKLPVEIDWPSFMAQQDLVWELFPGRWENGPFNGNGLIGSILHATPDSSLLRLHLCRSDIGKLDYPGHFRKNNRLQLGSMDLPLKGKLLFEQSSARLHLWDASLTAHIQTTEGSFQLRAFVVKDEPVLIVETFEASGKETGSGWQTNFNAKGEFTQNEEIHFFTAPDSQWHERSDVKSGGHVIAWQEKEMREKQSLRVSIHSSPSTHKIWNHAPRAKLSAKEDARQTFGRIKKRTNSELFEEQSQWWHRFYPKSFVSFQRPELESYYWIQLYKMASSSRKGYPMIDNHGVWSVEPVYGFATWDLNVQIIYRLHLASNHFDLGEPLLQFMDDNFSREQMYIDSLGEMRAGLRQQTFLRYRYVDPVAWEHGKDSPCDGPAKFLWGCHNYWLQFQYSQDSSLLPKLRDKLQGGVNAMRAGMQQAADDRWHVPYGHSWETWRGKDPNAHLGVLNWALETLQKIESDPDKRAKWQNFQATLAPYPTDSTGYLLGEGQPAKAHRHWSHLLHLFPLRTTPYAQDPALYQRSVDRWMNLSTGLQGGTPKAGYAPCGAMCLYAQMGKTEPISDLIDIFLFQRSSRGPNVWANTMYREYGPVIETPLFFAASLQELFLQSHENEVKVFPALPSEGFENLVFHDYRTEGGLRVSARRLNGKTAFILIHSEHGNRFLLHSDIKNIKAEGSVEIIAQPQEGVYDLSIEAGKTLLWYDQDFGNKAVSISPIAHSPGTANPFGLNEHFLHSRSYLRELLFEGR